MSTFNYHRFLDEAGDTTFYSKGKINIVGQQGVSNAFILGSVKFKEPLEPVRDNIRKLISSIETDPYFAEIPSIQKKINKNGFFFHATDDIPEVRKLLFDYITAINCSFEAVVGRKVDRIFESKHNGQQHEFYADLLSHILKNKLNNEGKLVLNIAQRANSTKHSNLNNALSKATRRFQKNAASKVVKRKVVFNVQPYENEPLLCITDYFCWAIQRVFERGETRYYHFLKDKISLVVDLYDSSKWNGSKNYYNAKNPLTSANRIHLT
jgi:hypothetical protein